MDEKSNLEQELMNDLKKDCDELIVEFQYKG